jgi:hypothetical protein
MIEELKEELIFPTDLKENQCQSDSIQCEKAELHDEFLDNSSTYEKLGIHWRSPLPDDQVHGSVFCRRSIAKLARPHPERETNIPRFEKGVEIHQTNSIYRPENISLDSGFYNIVPYPCLD